MNRITKWIIRLDSSKKRLVMSSFSSIMKNIATGKRAKSLMSVGRIVDALVKIKYKGFITMEMLPKPDPVTAAKCAVNYLKGLRI